jgi:hypothetical protein
VDDSAQKETAAIWRKLSEVQTELGLSGPIMLEIADRESRRLLATKMNDKQTLRYWLLVRLYTVTSALQTIEKWMPVLLADLERSRAAKAAKQRKVAA